MSRWKSWCLSNHQIKVKFYLLRSFLELNAIYTLKRTDRNMQRNIEPTGTSILKLTYYTAHGTNVLHHHHLHIHTICSTVTWHCRLNLHVLFNYLFFFNCHSTSSVKFHHVTVTTLCYSMIHFVYTHVIFMYNFGKK